MPWTDNAIDISFVVPQTFRFRMTQDLLGTDSQVLVDLLEGSGEQPPKVMAFVDASLPRADHHFLAKVEKVFTDSTHRLNLVEPPRALGGGEQCKNDPSLVEGLLEHFYQHGLDRRSYVVVIGGGALLDVVGYAAAIAHRGIRLVRIPTTTLAQADSGVGVKNAVNWFGKKNWKGTFAVPWGVINDHAVLDSLPQREFVSGFSEVVKVTLLKDAAAFAQIEADAERIAAREAGAVTAAIRTSVEMHLKHITEQGDPFEMLESRPLDFGHWSAHRLESMSDYHLAHGEAVAIGVAVDTIYSRNALGFPATDAERAINTMLRLGLPLGHTLLSHTEALLEGLEEFRQHLGGRLTLTLLKQIGQPVNVHEIDAGAMRDALQEVLQRFEAAKAS